MTGTTEPHVDEPGEAPQPQVAIGGRLRLGQAAFASVYADGILAVLSILTVPYLIGKLGTEPYGILGIVTVLAGQLGVLHFGVGTASTRLIAESLGRAGAELRPRLAAVATVAAAASMLIGGVFLFLAPAAWRGAFNVSAGTLPLALAAVPAAAALVALTPASAAVYGVLTAREMFLFSSALRLGQGAGRLFAAVFVVAAGLGVVAIFWAQALVDLIAVVVGSARAWSRTTERSSVPVRTPGARLTALTTVLAVGLPFALASLLNGLLTDAEKLAVGLARSVEDFTFYAVPFYAVAKYTTFSSAVVRVLMPRVAALGASGTGEAAALMSRADRVLITATVAILAPVVAFAPELLDLWVGQEFAVRSTPTARILIVGIAVNTAAFPAHAVVLARGRPAALTALYAAEVPLHLLVVYLLVNGLGLEGAAAAWTLRVVLDTFAQRWLAARALGGRIRDGARLWGSLAALGLFALAAPALPLAVRASVGAAISAGFVLRLTRGPERELLVDSILPWRWGGPRG